MKRRNTMLTKLLAAVCAMLLLTACGSSTDTSTSTSDASDTTDTSSEVVESTWPSKSVSILLNQTAGGGSDMLTRLLADALGDATGQSFAVVNDTSGASMTAYETIRSAKTDGYDIFATNCGMLTRIASSQYSHTLDEFTVLGLFTTPSQEGYGIYVKGTSQFESLEDLVAYDQANPGDLITSGQTGGFVMFMEAQLETILGIQPTFVEGGSDADRILTILGDSVDYCLLSTISARQYVESGDLRCLAMVSDKSELLPDVPTLSELGYDAITMSNLMFVLGPAGMSDADVQAIADAMKTASENQTLIDGYAQMNCVWEYKTPAESYDILSEMCSEMVDVYPTVQAMGLA